MEALFKNYFWVIKTLGIAAACGLAASAITTQVGAQLLFDSEVGVEAEGDSEGEGEGEGDDAKAKASKNKSKRKGFSFGDDAFGVGSPGAKARAKEQVSLDIRKHNIFCPTCVPETPTEDNGSTSGGVDASGRPTGPLIQPGETKSKLPLRLMATMEAEDPEHSFATILDEEAGVAGLYERGDLVRNGVVVMSVDQAIVHLRNNAALEYIELGEEPPPPPAAVSTARPSAAPPPPKKNDRSIPGAEEAINCPSEHSCTVERAFVEKLLANPTLLTKQARIVPKQKDDEIIGYKLYGIRRGSLPKLLGLKNGDMLTSVNGQELKGMDKAMALYSKLRRASNLSVSIQRKGKTINKEISIQ
ncbi:MAG: type II secretion system protein GspC [Myxococcota bacterium]